MGLLSGLGAASVLVFGLMAGVWVDRLPRRPILIATDLGRAAVLASIPLAAAYHVLGAPQLFVVAAVAGVLTVFFDVAYQSYLPSLVDRDQIVEGNTRLMLSATTAEVLGPLLTGILVKLITAPIAILFDAVSFVFSALMVGLISARPALPPAATHQPGWRESIAGLHFIAEHPVLRPLAIRSIVAYFFYGFAMPTYILFAIETLRLSTVQLGIVVATGGVAGILGSLFAARIVRRLGLGRTFLTTAIIQSVGFGLMVFANGPPAQAMVFLILQQLLGDSSAAIYVIQETSLRQTLVPDEMLGRVNAAMQLASRGVLPVSAVFAGFLASAIGIRPVLGIAAAGVLLSARWLVGLPIRDE